MNCSGAHEATSTDCPKLKNERRVLSTMVRDCSSHKEAAISLRRKRRRSRKSDRRAQCSQGELQPEQPVQLPTALPAPLVQGSQDTDPLSPQPARVSSGTACSVQWPPLPSKGDPKRDSACTNEQLNDQDRLKTEQVLKMLRHLINTMRSSLRDVQTQAAKIVVRVLDIVEPLLAVIL